MKYPLIAAKVSREIWALTPDVFSAIHAAVFNGQTFAMPMPAPPQPGDDDEGDDDAFSTAGSLGMTRVIPVFGILGKHLDNMEMACGGCSVDRISALLTAADKDPDCERIVLAFHSPGGTVTGIPELAAKIRDVGARKRIIAFTDGQCCSAALWLASQADTFLVSPSACVGSVGVYNLTLDESRRMEMEGVKVTAISDGKFKLAGAPFRALTAEETAQIQARVDGIGVAFRAALTAARTIAPEDMEGQTFSGEEAVAKGFADGLANDLAEVLEIAAG